MRDFYKTVNIRKIKPGEDFKMISRLLTDRMRKQDYDEQIDMGIDPYEAVEGSISISDVAYSAWSHGRLLCVFGVSPTPGENYIWMLGTDDSIKYKHSLVRVAKDFIRESLRDYGTVCNYITLKNKKALHFIKELGAIFSDPMTLDNGTEFVRFELRKKEV